MEGLVGQFISKEPQGCDFAGPFVSPAKLASLKIGILGSCPWWALDLLPHLPLSPLHPSHRVSILLPCVPCPVQTLPTDSFMNESRYVEKVPEGEF